MARFVFAVLEAVEWKWTPLDVLRQPEALLHDVMQLGGLNAKMRKILEDLNKGKV
jgi:hypothetical protein